MNDILHSAGPAVVAIGLDGRLTFANPAAERLIGCDEAELKSMFGIVEILAPGEGARLVAEMQKLTGLKRETRDAPKDRMSAYLDIVRSLPPSQVPSFDTQLHRKDGGIVPVTLHMSALRDANWRGRRTGGGRSGSGRDVASGAGSARIAGEVSRPV